MSQNDFEDNCEQIAHVVCRRVFPRRSLRARKVAAPYAALLMKKLSPEQAARQVEEFESAWMEDREWTVIEKLPPLPRDN